MTTRANPFANNTKNRLNPNLKSIYSSNPAENYERYFVPAIGEPLAKGLIATAALLPGEQVLDVACGTGIIARLASQQLGNAESVTGLDLNPAMLAVARTITPTIQWHEASAEAMPLRDETFDVVLCSLGLQFMENKSAALQEMLRVLTPNGRLCLNVPGSADNLFVLFFRALERHISSEAADFAKRVFSLYAIPRLRTLIKNAGFHDIDIQTHTTVLSLPSPKDFLWQYIYSTPLAAIVSQAEEESLLALERDMVEKWHDFEENGMMTYPQQIITVTARK